MTHTVIFRLSATMIALGLISCVVSTEPPGTITPKPTSTTTNLVVDGQEYATFGNEANILEAAFSPDHTTVAFGDFVSGQLIIWDLVNQKQVNSLPTWPFLKSIAYSPDGKAIATGHKSGGKNEQIVILVFDPINGKELHKFFGFADVSDLTFTPDSGYLAVAETGAPLVYSLAAGNLYKSYNSIEPATSVSLSPDGKTIAAGLRDGTIQLWNYANDKPLISIKGLENALKYKFVVELSFSPDGAMLVSGTTDYNIALWNSTSGELIRVIENPASVYSFVFSSTNRVLAVGTDNGVYLWAVNSGDKLCELPMEPPPIVGLDFVADETTIAAVANDGRIIMRDISQKCAVGSAP